jgi:hypothetical protein
MLPVLRGIRHEALLDRAVLPHETPRNRAATLAAATRKRCPSMQVHTRFPVSSHWGPAKVVRALPAEKLAGDEFNTVSVGSIRKTCT